MKQKHTVTIIILMLSTIGVLAEPRGWGLGVGVFDEDFGIHARKDFMFGERQQFEAVIQGGVYNQDKWTGRFDADFHYVFRADTAFRVYPLVGLDWAIHSKNNRAGANLGGGCTIDVNSETRLFVEAKYVAGDWDGYALTFGLYF